MVSSGRSAADDRVAHGPGLIQYRGMEFTHDGCVDTPPTGHRPAARGLTARSVGPSQGNHRSGSANRSPATNGKSAGIEERVASRSVEHRAQHTEIDLAHARTHVILRRFRPRVGDGPTDLSERSSDHSARPSTRNGQPCTHIGRTSTHIVHPDSRNGRSAAHFVQPNPQVARSRTCIVRSRRSDPQLHAHLARTRTAHTHPVLGASPATADGR